MTWFWILYFIGTLFIAYSISMLVNKRLLKVILFSFALSLMGTVWFKNPGEMFFSPIISIFILETTILESNGFLRILRPLIINFTILFLLSYLIWTKEKKD